MVNRELVSDSGNVINQNRSKILESGLNTEQACTYSAGTQDDLQLLDYPVGGVFESQNGMGNIGLGPILKQLFGRG